MTKQEVKEEFKKTEGDPLIKSRIRSIQMKMARQRMLSEVPEATVVVTNPVHYAVALKYETDGVAAPVVVAKGARLLAQKIKQVAQLHGVPVVENKPLARMLYKAVEVGVPIPFELYKAVAEVLAYVYRLKGTGVPR
jgi:flagellar biosynthetic protein FlhB